MSRGELISIHICSEGGQPMTSLDEVRAVAGKGLEGDRYLLETGTYSRNAARRRQVTLIEAEVLEALKRDCDIELDPNDSRRNLVTRGVALTHLVDKVFQVGAVTFRGLKINEPCAYFEKLIDIPGIENALLHRSGLNAEVLSDGVLKVGDAVGEPEAS